MLNNPSTGFEQLLEDDNIISEFKSMNPRLLEYCTNERLKRLFSFIVEEPPAEADRNRGYKFPFVACEILTADIQTIMSAFFGRNPNKPAPKNTTKEEADSESDQETSSPTENKTVPEQNTAPETKTEDTQENPEVQKTEEIKSEEETTTKTEETKQEDPEQENKPPQEKPASPEKVKEEGETKSDETGAQAFDDIETDKSEEVKSEEAKSEEVDLPEPDLAEYFFSFLDASELNVTLVGYFCRFLNILLVRRTTEIIEYLWNNPEIVHKLIKHLDHRAIAECLIRIFTMEGSNVSAIDNFIDVRIKGLQKIADIFKNYEEGQDIEHVSNAAFILVELINKRPNLNCGAQIEEYLNSKEFLDIIYTNALRAEGLSSHVLSVINSLVQLYLLNKMTAKQPVVEKDEIAEEIIILDSENEPQIQYLVDNLSKFAAFLDVESTKVLSVTYGNTIKPLGSARLRIVEIVANAAKLNNSRVNKEIIANLMFSQFMTLVTTFEWNNILHNIVEKLFTSLVEGPPGALRQHLLHDAKLLDFLHLSTRDCSFRFDNSKKRPTRRGYLGHITKIAKVLESQAKNENEIKEYITNDKWNEFDDSYLVAAIKNENQDLAGFTRKSSEENYDDHIQIGTSFDDYQNSKFNSFYSHGSSSDDYEVEEEEPDINERDDEETSPQKEVNTNYDSLDDEGKGSETWSKREADDTNFKAHTDKNLWNSTLKYDPSAFVQPEEQSENKYLNMTRELTIIQIEANDEPIINEFANNQYFAKPLDSSISVDDLLKEFENL